MLTTGTVRRGRSLRTLLRVAVAGAAASLGVATIGVSGAFAGHTTLDASVGCVEEGWTLNFNGMFYAAPFINLVRIRMLDGPPDALAQVPAAGYWDFPSSPNPNPPDFDHSVIGNVDFSLDFPQSVDTVTVTLQIHFVDLHIGVPGPPIEHPDTEEVRTITRTQNCTPPPETTTTTTLPNSNPTPPTLAPTTTVSPIPPAVRNLDSSCVGDAPFIVVNFAPETRYEGLTAHITIFDLNGNAVATHNAPYHAGGSARVIYPGASVDAAGNATDWPGWKLDASGQWVEDPSDAYLRAGLKVSVSVNPTFVATVAYPPASAGCGNPENVSVSSIVPPPTLPSTGSDTPVAVVVAAVASLALGGLAIGTARRRAHQS